MTTICALCSTKNPDELKYCKNCGASLAAPIPLTCSRCGNHVPAPSVFCNRCGERLVGERQKSKAAPEVGNPPAKMSQDEKTSTTNPPTEKPARAEHKNENVPIPEWLGRVYGEKESQIQLIPTHEVLRMANALGIDVDYSTLRFWQKRGLVKGPIRGPVTAGRGTRGYYDTSLLDRIAFIRRIQKHYSLGLESIQTELARLDKKINHASPESASAIYQQRLAEMEMQRVAESKRTMVAMLGKSLGISPEDIATVVIRKKDGQTIRMVTDKSMDESAGRQVPSQSSKAKTERE